MKILFVRSRHLDGDSRSTKMIADYQSRGFEVTPVVWTRGVDRPLPPGAVTFTRKGLQGARFRNAWYFLRWHLFLAWFLLRNARTRAIVHCVDFDSGIVAVPLARLTGKPVVYDGFDHFGSGFGGFPRRLFSIVERWLIRRSDILILPDEARLAQYGLAGAATAIVANVPEAAQIEEALAGADPAPPASGPLHLVCVGTLEARHRGLEYLPRLCEELGEAVRVTVGGIGALDAFFAEAARRLPNLSYIGYQSYPEALRVMLGADCLYGPYLLSAPAHLYAAPNKLFEHLALGRPLVTNTGTPPARFVETHGTGYLFDGSYEGVRDLVRGLDRAAMAGVGRHAATLWRERFADLRQQQVAALFERMAPLVRRLS